MKGWQTRAFDHKLGLCKDFSITHYFELSHDHLLAQVSTKSANKAHHRKSRNGDHKGGSEKKKQVKELISENKPKRTAPKSTPKAVDEDLYKIPPELLYQKSKHMRRAQRCAEAQHDMVHFITDHVGQSVYTEDMKKFSCQIPAFGEWDFSDGVPITQYFDSATNFFVEEKDLFPVPVQIIPAYAYHHQIKVIKNVKGEIKEKKKKQRKVCDLQKPKKDEEKDLYRISPELMYQKTKRKRVAKSFWFGCLGLNCIH
ncbi:hypothetical protein J5N97_019868 [Dioscorea zingiberensis]|uniref:Uncharacterized protein n=1 Tax=Dioscorea zingiberensis TaxID=325984 RepID=A0A9D5CFI1_9LILI|nr:hypothetical protein J5N97_019868 [Dioscorea zingiberensis]